MARRAPSGQDATGPPLDDEVLAAIGALLEALEDNVALVEQCRRRAQALEVERRRGRAYRDILPGGDEPLIVETMREGLGRLTAAASRFQHAEAKALYEEGLTMEQIGRLFGISHQRVSVMLKRAQGAPRGPSPRAPGGGSGVGGNEGR